MMSKKKTNIFLKSFLSVVYIDKSEFETKNILCPSFINVDVKFQFIIYIFTNGLCFC
jgi:hypothetical protein